MGRKPKTRTEMEKDFQEMEDDIVKRYEAGEDPVKLGQLLILIEKVKEKALA